VSAQESTLEDRIYGLLAGSALGDAAGGPVEFVYPQERTFWSTTDKALTEEGIEELASLFRLRPFPPEAEPYAQFEPYAPPGSVTDDTRWKMILFNCLEEYGQLDPVSFAETYWKFREGIPEKYDSICRIWQEEYGYVMNHYLDREPSYPPDRVWGGIPTMAGQMPYLPLAALHAGEPQDAYLATWDANILDVAYAKDITAAIVAGLSRALEGDGNWKAVISAMKETDPYHFGGVPWVPRKTNFWMEKAHELVDRSGGVLKVLYQLLEAELHAQTWWESHVPLVVSLAFLEITDYHPLASLQLCIEFGRDNDSYAQVVGAFTGAMYGFQVFPQSMLNQVNTVMEEQYLQNMGDWMNILGYEIPGK
jgi:ADP-ribosylglycohydrolase